MLKDMRIKAGLSQSKLATTCELNLRTLQDYEQGHKNLNNAKLKTLCKLAVALDCKISDLLTDSELLDLTKKATL